MVKSYVPQAIKAVNNGTYKGMIRIATRVTSQAKPLAPKDKGQLRASIDHEEDKAELEAVVGTNVEYGVYQEYGTRNMNAQPFLRPAVDIVTKGTNAEKAMAKAQENSVSRVLKKK